MNTGARVGLAVTAGYVLGRCHKMKWALAVAALVGRGRLPGGSGGLLQQGAKLLTSSPEFNKLTEEMRGRLMEAGKAAALATVSSRIDSLSEGLRERTDAMHAARQAGTGSGGAGDQEDAEGDRHRDEDERYRDEDIGADSRRKQHIDEDERSRVPAPRGGAPRREPDRAHTSRRSRSEEDAPARDEADQADHPSRNSGDDAYAHGGSSVRQREDSGRARRRSSASRTRGDSDD
jgi:hypothetical protein